MYREGMLREYLDDAASGQPTPGGGSVSALVGVLAAAMAEMTANFTAGKEQFADVEDEIGQMLEELSDRREALMGLVDRDVQAYGAVGKAYSMGRKGKEQKEARRQAIQSALRGAMGPPLEVVRECAAVGRIAARLVEIGNPNLITDTGVSAVLAEAAAAAAALNVQVNLKYLQDEDLCARTRDELKELIEVTRQCRRQVSRQVQEYLSG